MRTKQIYWPICQPNLLNTASLLEGHGYNEIKQSLNKKIEFSIYRSLHKLVLVTISVYNEKGVKNEKDILFQMFFFSLNLIQQPKSVSKE